MWNTVDFMIGIRYADCGLRLVGSLGDLFKFPGAPRVFVCQEKTRALFVSIRLIPAFPGCADSVPAYVQAHA
jgi:hypothetical protein